MAETIAVRNLLRRFGMPATAEGDRTVAWLATQGIDSATNMSIVNDTVLKSLLKQLASDARDLPADQRPVNNVVVTSAISVAIFGLRWYVLQRGQTADINLLQTMTHNNARDFFRLAYDECRNNTVDTSKAIDFPALGADVTKNSPTYQKFKEEFKLVADQELSSDGISTLGALLREEDNPMDWDDVDMSRSIHEIADDIVPFEGQANRDDNHRVHKYLVSKAFKYAGSSFPAKYMTTKNARQAIKDADDYYYPAADVELQFDDLEKEVRKVKWYGEHKGLTFEKCCGKLRSIFLRLDNIGRGYTEEKKVMVLLDMLKFKNQEITTAMIIIRGDKGAGGKNGDFELAQDYLKDHIPTAKDQKTVSIKAIDVAGDDYPDTFDEEGRTLSIEQRKEQCKPVAHTVWFNEYSQEKRDRIEADRIKFDLKKPGKKKGKGGDKNGGGGDKDGGGGKGDNKKTLKRKQQRAIKKLAAKEAKKAATKATIAAIKAAGKKPTESDDDDSSSSDDEAEDPSTSIKGRKKAKKGN